ncbi:hypothetical protein M2480_001232 [Parabacteroides sp. PFB2-12]|uniref:type IX secretion system anionic LPS delivery protein PorZ n=1 Tax=Parabacteroides sp. PFB2-12 TaxID=2940652 RepID=UPI002475C74C|nr:two-component regulator propeller domain-containing protein [Parabacteroides sp. PFB2-12]MDH6390259.1 hypothetical protein [Parabacteroides sp. PFB2-12]
MKRILFIFLFVLSVHSYGLAQGIGTWKSYMAYDNTTIVAEAHNRVFAVADGSLYSYGKEDESIRTYAKMKSELSDIDIRHMAYHPELKKLLLIYQNGNMDIYDEKGFTNIPHLMINTSIADKEIFDINFQGDYAYISAAFGVMMLHMGKGEISNTYKLPYQVYATCIRDNKIYAATANGLKQASMNENLLDPSKWESFDVSFPKGNAQNVRKIVLFQDALCFLMKGAGIYYLKADGTVSTLLNATDIQGMTLQNDKLLAYSSSRAYISSSLTNTQTVNTGTIYGISSIKENTYWIAAGTEMLKGIRQKDTANDFEQFLSGIYIEGPRINRAASMIFDRGRLYIAAGGRGIDRDNTHGTLTIYDTEEDFAEDAWFTFDRKKIKEQTGVDFKDILSVAVDPQDKEHIFASSWGEGLYEFQDRELVKLHDKDNSALESVDPKSRHYIRVQGLVFDQDNNLWMTNSEVAHPIHKLKPDGTWDSYADSGNDLSGSERYAVDEILVRSNNHKWVNLERAKTGVGVYVFDEVAETDHFFPTFKTRNTDDGVISANAYYCIAEDQNGEIWIGTNLGPIVIPLPEIALSNPENLYANRLIRTGDDGMPALYMDGVTVLTIVIDGGNRKWIGTDGHGLFILSEDGKETIEHFTAETSPLPSNRVESIAINPVTGEGFIGTDKGIVSYMGGATEGRENYSNVYAYPNPVRPEYEDRVTITGLMAESNVKITDINGNLLVQGKSLGGEFTWDCRKRNGERVSTGIYLVIASEPNRSESVVTKIMVVK